MHCNDALCFSYFTFVFFVFMMALIVVWLFHRTYSPWYTLLIGGSRFLSFQNVHYCGTNYLTQTNAPVESHLTMHVSLKFIVNIVLPSLYNNRACFVRINKNVNYLYQRELEKGTSTQKGCYKNKYMCK